jgi:hypothetical protein
MTQAATRSIRTGEHVAFELEERRTEVADLQIGMFVCRLDRPWEETPFPLQGIELARDEDLETLRRLCRVVYVDARRQVAYDSHRALLRTELSRGRFRNTTHYIDLAPVEEEAPRARAALNGASRMVDKIFEDINSGRELSVEHVEQAVRPLVSSVLRSADAFFLVEGLRRQDSYSWRMRSAPTSGMDWTSSPPPTSPIRTSSTSFAPTMSDMTATAIRKAWPATSSPSPGACLA